MGILPWSSTRGRLHPRGGRAGLSARDASAHRAAAHGVDEDLVELAGHPELDEGLQAVQAVASAPATPGELQGLDAALADYRATVPLSTREAPHEGRRVMTPETLGARIGVAAAGVLLLGFGGAGAFALTGSLPAGDTDPSLPVVASTTAAAHLPVKDGDDDEREDDDSARPKAAPTSAVGPDATGPAAFGLCNAWSHAKDAKKTAEHSVAFRNLVRAAGGVDKVDAYCAKVEHPSARAGDKSNGKDKGQGNDKGTGKDRGDDKGRPTTKPGKGPKDKPQGGPGQGRGTQGSATASPSTSS